MTTYPGSPRLLKGALVSVDPDNPLANIILFQYTPETLPPGWNPKLRFKGVRTVWMRSSEGTQCGRHFTQNEARCQEMKEFCNDGQ